MHIGLQDKRALVCGASRGIGRATAEALAAAGAEVVVLARRADALQSLVDELRASGHRATPCVADLDDLDPSTLPHDVHIVVHNTGGPPGGPLAEATADALTAAFRRHVLSAQAILQRVLPFFRSEGYGRWINVLSTSVYEPIDNLGVSNLTRAAMASWAKTLSRELPPGITLNNVLPGFTDTERLASLARARAERHGCTPRAVLDGWLAQVPEGRLAKPEETAALIAFLASPAAGYIRGQSIAVDGGRLRSI